MKYRLMSVETMARKPSGEFMLKTIFSVIMLKVWVGEESPHAEKNATVPLHGEKQQAQSLYYHEPVRGEGVGSCQHAENCP